MANGLFGNMMNPEMMGLLGAAGGLLQAGGPSRMPVGFGQAIGQGLMGGVQGYQQGAQFGMQQDLHGAKMEELKAKANLLNSRSDPNAPQQMQQFAPSNLGKLISEMNALPEGSPLKDAYRSAIRNISEGQERSPSYQFMFTPQGLVAGDRRSGNVEPRTLPGGAPILTPSADPSLQGQIAGARETATAAAQARSITPAAQREIIETEEQTQGAQSALAMMEQAKAINNKAMGFRGAGALAELGNILPESIRPEAVDATQNLDNILQSSALPQLKAIFGGMPTEGERKILLDIQGSSSKPPKVRAEIFDRTIAAIERRVKFNKEKAESLRGGTYFTGGAPQSLETPQRRKDDSSNDPLGLRKK